MERNAFSHLRWLGAAGLLVLLIISGIGLLCLPVWGVAQAQSGSPAVATAAGSLAPDRVTHGVAIPFAIDVINTGTAPVTLNALTTLSFQDGVSGTYAAALLTATVVPTSTAPDLVAVTLRFAAVPFPVGFLPGTYAPILHMHGIYEGGMPYSVTLSVSGNPLEVVDYVTPTLSLVVLTDTLSPADVIVGELVSFLVDLRNPNAMDITLELGTTLSFTASNGVTCSAALMDPVTLLQNASTTTTFAWTAPATDTAPGVYTPTLRLQGHDLGAHPYSEPPRPLPNAVTVLSDTGGLAMALDTLRPQRPTRRSMLAVWVDMTNTLAYPITLTASSRVSLVTAKEVVFSQPLLAPVSIPAGQRRRVMFNLGEPGNIPEGLYLPRFHLLGLGPGSTTRAWYLQAAETIDYAAPEEYYEYPVGMALAPSGYNFDWSPLGGIVQFQVSWTAPGDVTREYLFRWWTDSIDPQVAFEWDRYFEYLPAGLGGMTQAFLKLSPAPAATPGAWYHFAARFSGACAPPPSGGICSNPGAIGGYNVRFNATGDPEVIRVSPEQTFVEPGQPFAAGMVVRNPGSNVVPLDLACSDLAPHFFREGTPIDASFSSAVVGPWPTVVPGATTTVTAAITPSLAAPTGTIAIDGAITGTYHYPYYVWSVDWGLTCAVRHCVGPYGPPWPHPNTVDVSAAVTSSLEPGQIYVLSPQPLHAVPDSIRPQEVEWDAQYLTLSLRISNTSDLTFTLEPASFLAIDFGPTVVPGFLGQAAMTVPLALLPRQAVTLTFANGAPMASKPDGVYTPTILLRGHFSNALSTLEYHQPLSGDGNSVYIDHTPPVVIMDTIAGYRPASFSVSWSGHDALSGVAVYDAQYRTAPTGTWTPWMTQTASLSAPFVGTDGSAYAFRARGIDHADNIGAWSVPVTTTVDALPPVVTMASLPSYELTTNFTVSWSGLDTASGVYSYALVFRDTGGPWSDWLTMTAAATVPKARTGHGWVYDSARQRFILFGGFDATGQPQSDTWELVDSTWHRIFTPQSPPPRASFVMVYDSARGKVVLFGGTDEHGTNPHLFDDTWEYDGTTWTQVTGASTPGARLGSGAAYDTARERIILFGGTCCPGTQQVYADTWEYDGTTWTKRYPAHSPSGRCRGQSLMAYDSQRQRVILHGGWVASLGCSRETWEYDGSDWTLRTASGPCRQGHSINYDVARGRILQHGGYECTWWTHCWPVNGTWEYNPTTALWYAIPVTQNTTIHNGPTVYDPDLERVLLACGATPSGQVLNDTWSYSPTTGMWWKLAPAGQPAAPFSGLDGHTYAFRGRATDSVGNLGAWALPVTTTVDTAPPTAVVGSLPAYAPALSFTVSWSGEDTASGVAHFDLQAQEDGGTWSDWLTQTVSSSSAFTGVDGHRYGFRVRATDRAGHVGAWSLAAGTTVDASPPTATLLVAPFAQTTPFAVAWSGYDATSGVAFYDVQMREGAGAWSGWQTHTAALSATLAGIESHSYAFRARATDWAGLTGTWSGVLTTTVDTIAPTAAAGALPTYELTSTFPVTWTGADATSGVFAFDLQARDGGGPWTDWLLATPTISATFAGLDGHTYSFRARATDNAGNTGEWSAAVSTTVDTTAPTAAPQPLPTYTPTDTFGIAWSGSDATSGVATFDLQVQDNGTPWVEWLTDTAAISATFAGQDGHTYAFRARATDHAGHTGSWSASFATTVDTTAPAATAGTLPQYSSSTTFVVTWDGTDATSGIATFDLQVSDGGGPWTGWLVATPALSATYSGLDGHTYAFRARATDHAGHTGSWSAAVTTTVDATAPTAALDPLPPYGTTATFSVAWSGFDATAGVATFDLQVQDDGGPWNDWLVATPAYSGTFAGVDGHTYAFRARATDSAGHTGAWSAVVSTTVDVTPPTAAVAALPAYQPTDTFTVTWSGYDVTSGVATFDLQVQDDGGPWADWLAATPALSETYAGVDGHTYAFRARATDRAGLTGPWSLPVATTVDTTAPTAVVESLPAYEPAAAFSVAWSGQDAGSGVATFDVQARADGGPWADWLAATPALSETFAAIDGHTYAFRARASDQVGNTGGWSPAVSTTVDTTAPTAAMDPQPPYHWEVNFAVSWNGYDATSGVDGFRVQARAGDVWFDWISHTTALSETFPGTDCGGFGFRVQAVDRAGHLSEWSAPVTTSVDIYVPTATLAILPPYVVTTTVQLSWDGGDDCSGLASFNLQVRDNGGDWTDWLSPTLAFSGTFSGQDDHAYAFRARAVDYAGHASDWTATVSTTVDVTPPTAAVAALPAYQPTDTFTVTWSGYDVTSGVATFDLQVQDDGGPWADWLAATPALSETFAGVDGHTYAFRARATDRAGLTGPWSPPVATTVDTTAPTAVVVPLPTYETTSLFTVTWSGYDAVSGVATFDLQVQEESGPWSDWLTATPALSETFAGVDGHTYAFRARAMDQAGHTGNWSAVAGTTVDATPPTSMAEPLPPVMSRPQFTLTWTGQDGTSGIAAYDMQVQTDGGAWSAWISATQGYTATFEGQTGHTYAFRSRATDAAGNVEAWPTGYDTYTTIEQRWSVHLPAVYRHYPESAARMPRFSNVGLKGGWFIRVQ